VMGMTASRSMSSSEAVRLRLQVGDDTRGELASKEQQYHQDEAARAGWRATSPSWRWERRYENYVEFQKEETRFRTSERLDW